MTTNGIVFSATQSPGQQTGTGSANTLDEYEVGSYSPALQGTVSYNTQIGGYVKTGMMTDVRVEVATASWSSAAGATMSLPFACESAWYAMCAVWYIDTAFTDTNDRFGGHLSGTAFNQTKMHADNDVTTGDLNLNTTGRLAYGLTYKST
jgi:hypothetical protein